MQTELTFPTQSPINKPKFNRQNKIIYDALASGEIWDMHKAIKLGIYNNQSRISDLRNKHSVIIYDQTVTNNGNTYKEYSFTPFIK